MKSKQSFFLNALYVICLLATPQFLYGQLSDTLEVPVEIKTSRSYDKGVVTLSRSQFLSFPGSFDDPSRLLIKYPGISTLNDQANAVIYHGLPSHFHQWQLYGARILNPNHLSGAGTQSDNPSRSSGGVNMMSGQVIGSMKFYGNPSSKSLNSLAGNSDVKLRDPYRNNINLNVSLIGMEAGIDRVFGKEKNQNLMLNYRYSTVGLLTDFGLDFGGEVIKYQDATAKYSIKTKKAGTFNIYGIWGKSSNEKDTISPALELKDFELIDYGRKGLTAGVNYQNQISKTELLTATINYNQVNEERQSFEFYTHPDGKRKSTTLEEEMISWRMGYEKNFLNHSIGINLLSSYIKTGFDYFLRFEPSGFADGDVYKGHSRYLNRFENQISGIYTGQFENILLRFEPAIIYNSNTKSVLPVIATSLQYKVGEWILGLDYSISRQEINPEYHIYFRSIGLSNGYIGMHSLDATLRYRDFEFKPFYHKVFEGFEMIDGTVFSSLDEIGYYPTISTFTGGGTNIPELASSTVEIYGLDLSYKTNVWGIDVFSYISIFEGSQKLNGGGVNIPNNFGHIANINISKKWKINDKRYFGMGLSMHHRGGAYQSRVDVEKSLDYGFTNYETDDPYSLRLASYFRADMRLYYIVKKGGYKSTISLDIQNITNRENDAFYYYEPVDQASKLRKQLGLLPVLSWRVSI